MIIETKSGSKYIFTVRGDKIYLLNGSREYLVSGIPAITIGKPMEFTAYALNMYCKPTSVGTYFKSTPVASVKM